MAMITDAKLMLLIERVERIAEEKQGAADDMKDVFSEAKSQGYDTKIMRQLIRLRKMSRDTRAEQDALLDTYRAAIGLN